MIFEGAWGKPRRKRNRHVDNNPFDGNGIYTPRVKNSHREGNRLDAKRERINNREDRRERKRRGYGH